MTENGHINTNQSLVAGTKHLAVELTFYSDSKYQHEFSGFPPHITFHIDLEPVLTDYGMVYWIMD
jgi:hypothetical protein